MLSFGIRISEFEISVRVCDPTLLTALPFFRSRPYFVNSKNTDSNLPSSLAFCF